MKQQTKDELLHLYDFYVRAAKSQNDYNCGYADGIAQCVLDIAKFEGIEDYDEFEAYKRAMQFESVDRYIAKYPTPVEHTEKL